MLEVRPALPSEFAAIGDLTASTYLTEGFAGPDYAEKLRDVAGRADQTTVLAALLEGRLVGTVTVVTGGGPYSENTDPGTAVVRMLVTDPSSRSTGVGTALVEAAIAEARRAGCSVARLSTHPSMAGAHRVYERLGFRRTPEHDWWPEPELKLLTYALPLAFCGHCGEPLVRDCGEPLVRDCGEPLVRDCGEPLVRDCGEPLIKDCGEPLIKDCGEPLIKDCGEPGTHARCERMLELEPPRYCRQCRRRMVVQVHPTGWSARCVEHGVSTR